MPAVGSCVTPTCFLNFSFIRPPPKPQRGVPSPLGTAKAPGQWVRTDAAHPAHQAGAEPPLLPGQQPLLHLPSPGWRALAPGKAAALGEGSSGGTSRSPSGGCGRMSSGPQLLPPSHFLPPVPPAKRAAAVPPPRHRHRPGTATPVPCSSAALQNPSAIPAERLGELPAAKGRAAAPSGNVGKKRCPAMPSDARRCAAPAAQSPARSACGHRQVPQSRALPAGRLLACFSWPCFPVNCARGQCRAVLRSPARGFCSNHVPGAERWSPAWHAGR